MTVDVCCWKKNVTVVDILSLTQGLACWKLFAGAMNINTGMRAKGMPWYLVGDGGGGVGIYDKKTVIL